MDHHLGDTAVRALIALFAMLAATAARAHAEWQLAGGGQEFIVAAMLLSGVLYARGLSRLWKAAGRGRGVARGEAWCYATGWGAVGVALLSPLDAVGEHLFSAHMLQHEVLMLAAAPLLVAGRPLATWSWALPVTMRLRITRALAAPAWSVVWTSITRPLSAWALHAAALWGWHAPALFAAARVDPLLHALQHASFFVTALLFWWSLLRPHARGGMAGGALLYLFTTMLHTGALGALLVFASEVWYPANSVAAAEWGWTALEDQQIGGLIMWIPGGLVYLAIALLLLGRALAAPAAGRTVYR
jgi:putative membrane protein